uniref:Uncharacterized protein n=2 Tax=Opuntia streptacantha TaxID=393608 RepID=A0A7C9AD74_OPUST
MDSSNKNKGSESLNDIMYRRLKNRERQRRYRERKRLQADASKSLATRSLSDPSQWQIVPLPNNGMIEQVVTRIHCTRDWKKDARRVHAAKKEAASDGHTSNGHSVTGENLMEHSSGKWEVEQTLKSEVPSPKNAQLDNSDKLRGKQGRRAWKAEARNKK